jgi:hypothetical protein
MGAGHALTPAQVRVLVVPSKVTPPGQAEAARQVTLQSAAVQVTPAVHELAPQVTVHLLPAQATAPQPEAAEQLMLHSLAAVQSMFALVPAVTEQGKPGGQVHEPVEQSRMQVPASPEPPLQAAGHAAASNMGCASSDASADASPPSAPVGPPSFWASAGGEPSDGPPPSPWPCPASDGGAPSSVPRSSPPPPVPVSSDREPSSSDASMPGF